MAIEWGIFGLFTLRSSRALTKTRKTGPWNDQVNAQTPPEIVDFGIFNLNLDVWSFSSVAKVCVRRFTLMACAGIRVHLSLPKSWFMGCPSTCQEKPGPNRTRKQTSCAPLSHPKQNSYPPGVARGAPLAGDYSGMYNVVSGLCNN